jgi:hypothetical protein
MVGLFYFVRGGEFNNTFDQCTEINFLPARGDVEHGFCRRLGLSAARFGFASSSHHGQRWERSFCLLSHCGGSSGCQNATHQK